MTIMSRGQYGNDALLFDKTWAEMEEPFGIPGEEYWFGLRNLFQLTYYGDYELKVQKNGLNRHRSKFQNALRLSCWV